MGDPRAFLGDFFRLSFSHYQDFLKLIQVEFSYTKILIYNTVVLVLQMIPVYINYFVGVPRYFIIKKILLYLIFWLLIVMGMCLIICVVEDLFLRPHHPDWLYTAEHLFGRIPYFIMFTFLINFSFLFDEVMRKQKLEAELKKANAETELKWLKAQVNPHFLFNVLNNIYSLAYVQSEKTASAVMKLSELMRYMLQESNTEKITIEKEAAYLDHYIQLQLLKKRYSKKIITDVKLGNPSLLIEPMLLINFVENAFKHSNLEEQEAWIKMKLETVSNSLYFTVINTYGQISTKDKTTGIGLENVKQRLQLLYPGHHSLSIKQADGVHTVHLTIDTAVNNE